MPITRRDWLLSSAAAFAGGLSAADRPSSYYRDYSRCLPDYLSALARAAYDRRSRDLALLTSAGAIRKRQQWVTETFWALIGGKLERSPLNASVTGQFERDGYRLEKVVYESRPGLFVTSSLYLPANGKPPYPGILFNMGHALQGKAYPSYQKCCQGLARLGFVVLAFDPMGQGERIYYPGSQGGTTRLGSADDEHTHPGKQLLLLGTTASQFQLWDAIRGLDYLAGHPLVDPQRLGSTGQSGGGTITMMLAAVDPRLSAAVVCSGNTENMATVDFNPPGATDDAEQDFLYSGPLGFDRWDLLYSLAPKPLLVQVSAHDFFGTYSPRYLQDGKEQYAKLARVYQMLGHREHLDWLETPLPHGLNYSFRLDTYNWFSRWLNHSDRQIEQEPPVKPESTETLSTGHAGNVLLDYHSQRPFDLVQAQASRTRQEDSSQDLWKRLQVRFPAGDIRLTRLAQTPSNGLHIEALEVQSAPQVWIPAWYFIPVKRDDTRPLLLVLDESGRNAGTAEDGLYAQLARSGVPVCAGDLRGIGDSRGEVGRGNPHYTIEHDSEEDFAWASLILGKSLLSQRIEDILALAQSLKNDPSARGQRLVIAARGRLTIPALFAFAASPLIDSAYLAAGLVSYRNLLETEYYRQPLANLDFDLYRKTDLPLLVAQAAPRIVHLAGTVDAAGQRVTQDDLKRSYPSANVRLTDEPAWDPKALQML